MAENETLYCSTQFTMLRGLGAANAVITLEDAFENATGSITLLRGEQKDVNQLVSVVKAVAAAADVRVEPGEGDPPYEHMHTVAKDAGFEIVITEREQDGEATASIVITTGELAAAVKTALTAVDELRWAKYDAAEAAKV